MALKIKLPVRNAIAQAFRCEKKKSLSWYDKLAPERKEWCDELKKAYQSGSCSHVSVASLRNVVNESLSLTITDHPFRVWIKSALRTKKG